MIRLKCDGPAVDAVIAACRAHGLSVTPQRLAIFRCLASSSEHPSAEAVHEDLRRKMPTVSLATVYKTLETLTAVGVIRPLTYMRGRMRYDANLTPHHHLVCTRCQAVEDVRDKRLDEAGGPARTTAARHGFSAGGHAVEVWGLCRACAGRAVAPRARGVATSGRDRSEPAGRAPARSRKTKRNKEGRDG